MGKKRTKKSCSSSQLSNSRNSSFESFINNDSLKLPEEFIVSPFEAEKYKIYAKSLRSEWKDVVFLHPLVMKEYEIQDLVLIKGEEKTILCVAYPVQSLQKTVIVFPKGDCPFKYQESVVLEKYEHEIKCATEILITFNEENYYTCRNMDNYILKLLSNQYIYEGLVLQWKFFDRDYQCPIKSVNCSPMNCKSNPSNPEFYVVSYKTSLRRTEDVSKTSNDYQIGGLKKQLTLVKCHIEKFLNRSAYCGVLLLKGPSGTGKSLVINTVLKEITLKNHIEHIVWYKLCAMPHSEITQVLEGIFQRAVDKAPSTIVIEDFNCLCPNKTNAGNLHLHISKCLSKHLRSLKDARVMIIASASDSEYDSSVFQQSERLLEVITFYIPTADERIDILEKLLAAVNHKLIYEEVKKCAEMAHGFTGKELLDAIKDAQVIATKREFPEIFQSNEFLNNIYSKSCFGSITYSDLHFCIRLRKKAVMAAGDINIKKVQWSDIGGMSIVKEKLKQVVEWPLKYPDAFKTFNITASRGVLMYGPPGCSKTMIAKALATECELNFISKNAADLYDKYVGESEKSIRDLFLIAKTKSPCIIFLDEIDALVTGRESESGSSGVGNRIVTTLLTEMDGIEELHGVIIIAATNRPDMLDEALVRNGRINHFIYVSLPDASTREEILKISMKKRSLSDDFDFKVLAEKTEGYSGAEIVNLCNEAALQLLAENPKSESPVFKLHHFECALKYVLPRTNKDMIHFYESFSRTHCI